MLCIYYGKHVPGFNVKLQHFSIQTNDKALAAEWRGQTKPNKPITGHINYFAQISINSTAINLTFNNTGYGPITRADLDTILQYFIIHPIFR